jgi:hypothetical protein
LLKLLDFSEVIQSIINHSIGSLKEVKAHGRWERLLLVDIEENPFNVAVVLVIVLFKMQRNDSKVKEQIYCSHMRIVRVVDHSVGCEKTLEVDNGLIMHGTFLVVEMNGIS